MTTIPLNIDLSPEEKAILTKAICLVLTITPKRVSQVAISKFELTFSVECDSHAAKRYLLNKLYKLEGHPYSDVDGDDEAIFVAATSKEVLSQLLTALKDELEIRQWEESYERQAIYGF